MRALRVVAHSVSITCLNNSLQLHPDERCRRIRAATAGKQILVSEKRHFSTFHYDKNSVDFCDRPVCSLAIKDPSRTVRRDLLSHPSPTFYVQEAGLATDKKY